MPTTRGARRAAITLRSALAIGLGAGLWAAPLAAKLCGDDVDGHDVPCACGDVVVSSVALASDPILGGRCPHDGLIVRAPDAARTVVIDLQGHTLRGSGTGVGIRLVAGGQGGARGISSGGAAPAVGVPAALFAPARERIRPVGEVR